MNIDVGLLSSENMSQVLHLAGRWCLVLDGLLLPRSERDQQSRTATDKAAEYQHYITYTKLYVS